MHTGQLTGAGQFELTNLNVNGTTRQAALTLDQTGDSTFAGRFTGTGSLTKTGAGALTLTGANTATGGLTVNAGTVDTTGGGTLADTGAITIQSGATFIAGTADTVGVVSNAGSYQVNAVQTVASLDNMVTGTTSLNADLVASGPVRNNGIIMVSGSRQITTQGLTGSSTGRIMLTNATDALTLNQSGNSIYAGQINGTGPVTKTGNGVLHLTGANGFGGGLQVNAGTIDTTGGGTLSDSGTITIQPGAGFIAGTADITGAVTNNGIYQVNAVQQVASLHNTATGTSTLQAALLTAGSVHNDAGGTINQQADILAAGLVDNEGLIEVTGNHSTSSGGYTGAGTTDLNAGALLTVWQNAGSVYSGRFTGAGALAKGGSGTLTLTGANTATGGLTVIAGTVDTTGGGTLADTGAITIQSGATFIAGTADTVGAVSNAGNYLVNTAQTVASLGNAGSGTTRLNADLTATGPVSNDGRIVVSGTRQVTTTGLTGGSSGQITLANASDALALNQSGNSTYSGQLSGAGSVTKSGDGTLTLNKPGGFDVTSLIIDQGTVALDGAYILAERVGVTVNSTQDHTGTLSLLNGDQRITNLSGAGNVALGSNRLTVLGDSSFTGHVSGTGVLDIRQGSFQVNDSLTSTDPNSIFNVGSQPNAGGPASNPSVTVNSNSTLAFPRVDLQPGSTLVVQNSAAVQSGNINLNSASLLEVTGGGNVNTGNAGALTMTGSAARLLVHGGANVQTGTLDVTGTSGNRLDIVGNLQTGTLNIHTSASNRADAAVLHLGDVTQGLAGTVSASGTTVSGGLVSGVGRINGSVTMGQNSWLAPGNSPGQITVGNLALQTGSTTEMQVAPHPAGARVAGSDYDQVVVNGNMSITGNAVLQLQPYNGGTVAAGEAIQLFAVQPGKVSGQFGSVQNSGLGNVVYSLGSGSVVGLGAGGYGGFLASAARTENQSRILSDLMVSDAGGVQQFYGGKLVERLAAAYAVGADTGAVFARFSPEVYASLMDQVKTSLLYSAPGIADDLQRTPVGLSASYFSRELKTGSQSGQASYDVRASGVRLGYGDIAAGDIAWRGNLMLEHGKVGGDYFNSSGDGYSGSVQLAKPLASVSGLYLTGRLGYGEQRNDVTRQTNDGPAHVKGLGSRAWLAGVGLAHVGKAGSLRLQSAVEVVGYSAEVDGFSESNSQSVADALSVKRQSQSGGALVLSVGLSGAATEQLELSLGGQLVSYQKRGYDVTASLNTENTPFTVHAKGLSATQFNLNAGALYHITPVDSLGASVQGFNDGGYQANVTYNHSF
ncbi:autotransporter-associated beta strand repeat-containing protein [Laribacter hongkongensis]|nr:autotransporter-associated beta strand repeat-containing protein [Laribacter hongkongensis]